MNAKLKELLNEIRQRYEYNDQFPQMLSDLVEHIVKKTQLTPKLVEALNVPKLTQIGQGEVDYIKEILLEIISTSQSDELVGGAIETLSLFSDPKHAPILRQKLELYLKKILRANHPFTACIHALDNCGENLKHGTSFGIDEVEKNLQIARDYLLRHNRRIPW